jgi:hypothetical protein
VLETLEAKIIAAVLGVALIAAGTGYVVIRVLDAGKAECMARVESQATAAALNAQKIDDAWKGRLTDAENRHQVELAQAGDTVLAPLPLIVPKYTAAPAGVSASPTPAHGGPPAPTGGGVCSSVLSESPGQLRNDFAAAELADQLVADYRMVFESWPTPAPVPR